MVTTTKSSMLVLALLVSSAACASRVTSPSTVVIEVPNTAVQQTRLLSTPRILCFGDSLTEGADGDSAFPPVDPSTPGLPHSYPYKLQALLAARYPSETISIFNGGVGGATAAAGLSRLSDLMTRFKPDAVILLYGVNDLNNGASIDAVTASMSRLISEIQAREAYTILSTLPRQIPGAQRAFAPTMIQPYNAALQQLSLTGSAIFSDIYPLVTESLIARDGLHITESGNAVMAAAYSAVLQRRFEYAQAAGLTPAGTRQ